MSEHNNYSDTVNAEIHSAFDCEVPEPLESWSLEDFEDVIGVDAR